MYVAAALLSALISVLCWRRVGTRGARPLALLTAAATTWALGAALELHAPGVAGKILVSKLQYLGIPATAPAFLEVAMALARVDLLRRRLARPAFWSIAHVTLLLALTNEWHGLVWRSIDLPATPGGFSVYHYGPWFWVFLAYDYACLLVGSIVLLRAAARMATPFRTGVHWLVLGVAAPWIANVIYVFKLGPLPGLDWTVVGIAAMAAALAWTVLGHGLLDPVPIARAVLLDAMTDGVAVLDRRGRLAFSNPALRALLGSAAQGRAAPLGPGWEAIAARLPPAGAWSGELAGPGERPRTLEVRVDPIRDGFGDEVGRLALVRDVTARREAEAERERLLGELQQALSEVQRLEGLLPICASCNQVRDDQGYWSQLDAYLSTRLPVQFTHGICPDCLRKLYPDYADRLKKA